VRENWKMSRNLCCQGNVKQKYYFGKVRENNLGSCRLQITVIFASPNIKKQANLWLSLNIQKLNVFQLPGAFVFLTPRPGPLLFAYCSINAVSLVNIIYDICAIGLLFQ